MVPWCGSAPTRPVPAIAPVSVGRASPQQPELVAPVIRALLDTTAAGSALAADERLGLQAGSEVRSFYGSACLPAWTPAADSLNSGSFNSDITAALALLSRAPEYGLRAADYGTTRLQALRDSLIRPVSPGQRVRQQALLEVYLSDAVLCFMRDIGRGRLRPHAASAREKAVGLAAQPAGVLRAALSRHAVPAAMLAGQPTNREYRQLQQALARWLTLPVAPDSVAYQRARYEQVALNLERWRWEAWPPAAEYVLINIPAYELQVVAHDSVRRRHRVIVGKPQTRTPTLSSSITHFTLAPGWHVPRSIATKDLLPRVKKDAGYLARNNYALYDDRGRQLDPFRISWARVTAQNFAYTIRQSPGCDNALGNIVFRFANPYSVYVHDTPQRQLFARSVRALSHGCIRLEQPMQLAAYLLGREGNLAQLPTEDECARSPRPSSVYLRRPMPLYVRYATCTAENGYLQFLPDIYHRDELIRRALFGPRA